MPLLGGNDIWGQGGRGLYDTYWAQILPWAASPFAVFLLRQFFLSVPNDYYEAAQLDGASRFTFFTRIALPLARPALVTSGLFGFLGSWNALLWPLIVTSQPGRAADPGRPGDVLDRAGHPVPSADGRGDVRDPAGGAAVRGGPAPVHRGRRGHRYQGLRLERSKTT